MLAATSPFIARQMFAILSYMKSLSLSTPHVIVVVGIPGAGKTFFAAQFASTFNAPLLSADTILPALPDQSPDDAALVLKALLPEFLKTGKTLLVDGTGAMRVERAELAKQAKEAGYQTLIVWVQTDTPTAKQRSLKPARGTEKQPLSLEAFDYYSRKFSPPHQSEKYIVLSGKHTYASQAKMLLRKLSAPRTEHVEHLKRPEKPISPVVPKRSSGSRISIS